MKPGAFEYHAPRTLDEAVALLAEHGEDAKVLAGGQSLVPLMNLRMAVPEVLVDLNRLDELAYVREDGGAVAIGAMTRYVDVETSTTAQRLLPMTVRATAEVGYPAIRSRGTAGGSIAHADPVGEWPCLARTLDAEMVATSARGTRTVPAEAFFTGIFDTALEPDEVLTEVRFPVREGASAWGFREFARKAGDYAVVAVAVDLAVEDGVVRAARVGFSNLGDRPVRSAAVEAALVGVPVGRGLDPATGDALVAALRDERAGGSTPADRLELAGVMARRTVDDALTSGRGSAA